MYETKKTAQMRLKAMSHTNLRKDDPALPRQFKPYKIIGRFAMIRKDHAQRQARRPDKYIPKRPLIETLIGSMESNHVIKPINCYGGEN